MEKTIELGQQSKRTMADDNGELNSASLDEERVGETTRLLGSSSSSTPNESSREEQLVCDILPSKRILKLIRVN